MSRSSLRQSLARSESKTVHLRTHIRKHPQQPPDISRDSVTLAVDIKKRSEDDQDVTEVIQTVHVVNYVRDEIASASLSASMDVSLGGTQSVDSDVSEVAQSLTSEAAAVSTGISNEISSIEDSPLTTILASVVPTTSTRDLTATTTPVLATLSSEQSLDVLLSAGSSVVSTASSLESSTSIVNDVISGISYTGSYFATGTAGTSAPYPTASSRYNVTASGHNSTGVFYNGTSYSATGSVHLLGTGTAYSTGVFSTWTSSSIRKSTSTSHYHTSTATSSAEVATSTTNVVDIFATSGSDTASSSDTSSSSNKSSGSGLTPKQTSSVIGGVVGGMAGVALVMVLVMMALKYKKNGGQIKLLDGNSPRGLIAAGPSSGPNALGPISESSASVLASFSGFKAVKGTPEPSPSLPVSGSEPAFVRVSGRKLPSVLEHGGDGYTDPRSSVMTTETINYRDSTYDPSSLTPGQPLRFALGSPMRPVSGIPVLRDSPARSIPSSPYVDEPHSAGASSAGFSSPPESPADERRGLMVRGMPPVETVGRSLTVVHPGVQRHSTVGHFSEDV